MCSFKTIINADKYRNIYLIQFNPPPPPSEKIKTTTTTIQTITKKKKKIKTKTENDSSRYSVIFYFRKIKLCQLIFLVRLRHKKSKIQQRSSKQLISFCFFFKVHLAMGRRNRRYKGIRNQSRYTKYT